MSKIQNFRKGNIVDFETIPYVVSKVNKNGTATVKPLWHDWEPEDCDIAELTPIEISKSFLKGNGWKHHQGIPDHIWYYDAKVNTEKIVSIIYNFDTKSVFINRVSTRNIKGTASQPAETVGKIENIHELQNFFEDEHIHGHKFYFIRQYFVENECK
jgi:hypothetical protein